MKKTLLLLAILANLPVMAQGVRKTADEFNKMSRSDTSLVILHGTANKMRKDDTRGVFYLRDATGDAYIYGLVTVLWTAARARICRLPRWASPRATP